jgi:hypothetical protein
LKLLSNYQKRQVVFLLHFKDANISAPVRDLFESSGFYDVVPKSRFYPSVHDAIISATSDATAEQIDDNFPVSCHL